MNTILSISVASILAAAAYGQNTPNELPISVAHGLVRNQFVVYSRRVTDGAENGLLVFTVPEQSGNSPAAPQNFSGSKITEDASAPGPQLREGSRRNAGTVADNTLIVIGDDNHLYTLNLNNPNSSSVTWSKTPTNSSDFNPLGGTLLLTRDRNTLYALSSFPLQPTQSVFEITLSGTESFTAKQVGSIRPTLANPQFGYETNVRHLVVVGTNSSGKLGVEFFDPSLKPVTRKVIDTEAPSPRSGFCFTWGDGAVTDLNFQVASFSAHNPGEGSGDGTQRGAPSEPLAESSPSAPPIGAIVGGVVGGLVLILIILGLIICRRRKLRKGKHRSITDDDDEVVETKSRSMASQGTVPLVPSPFVQDDDANDHYNLSANMRTPTGSSSFTAASTLYSTAYAANQPLVDNTIVSAVSSPEYMTYPSSSPQPPQPNMSSQPFSYHPYPSSSLPLSTQGSPYYGQSSSQPMPPPTEVEIQSRAVSLPASSGVSTPHQPFESHATPYRNMAPLPPLPPNLPPFSGSPTVYAGTTPNTTSAPAPIPAPVTESSAGISPPEPEWDVLIPVTDDDDMSTQAALGMTSTVGGLSASHREFKHELPDSDTEDEAAIAGAPGTKATAGKRATARRQSVASVASHADTETGIGFLEPWVPPNDEPPVPPVPQLPQ
ncbi:hypothetical protein BGW41_002955 [Actinomortierella wolfii]|nr:hypothetical protein BGW41_002955 [Actinomortierella wolfii]